ncbi:MAG: hypothetical protein V1725_00740 [archaeon]
MKPLLEYRKTGGFAGLNHTLRIYDDGSTEFFAGKNKQSLPLIPQERIAAITDMLNHAFPNWNARYENRNVVDGFTYEITYNGRTVKAQTGACPAALSAVTDALDKLLK